MKPYHFWHHREIARINPVPANQMNRWIGRYVTMAAWWITGKTVKDKDSRPIEVLSFEDMTAILRSTSTSVGSSHLAAVYSQK